MIGGNISDDHLIDSLGNGFVHAHAGGGVGLRIKVAQQNPFASLCQRGGEVDAGGCLSNTALLVDNGDDSSHRGTSFLSMVQDLIYYSKLLRCWQGKPKKFRKRNLFHVKQRDLLEREFGGCFT